MNTQILSEYLEYLELERGLSKNTIDAYRRDLILFLDYCNNSDFNNITRMSINRYVLFLHEQHYNP